MNSILLHYCTIYQVACAYICSKPASFIPAKPLHNHDIVSVLFKDFYCMGIGDKLSRHLFMLTYIYVNVDEC